jgi:hypothetical protein
MSEESGSGWKLLSVVLVTVLIAVCFVGLYSFSQPVAAGDSKFIGVSIDGPDKLGVNETGVYRAVVNETGNFNYNWSVSPDSKVLLTPNGEDCSLVFVSATVEPYILTVQVSDELGGFGFAYMTVYDPYTSPSLYLNGALSRSNVIVESDGLGWFRSVNATTGATITSGTNGVTVLTTTIAACNSYDVIGLKTPLSITGTLTITKPVTLIADVFANGYRVHIDAITVDSNSVAICNLKLQGIDTNMLLFNARSSHAITYCDFNDMQVTSAGTATSEGIVFSGDGTTEIHDLYFNRYYFYDGGQYARSGFISWTFKNSGNGQVYFNDGTYSCYNTGNAVLLAYETNGASSPPVVFSHLDCVTKGASTSFTLVQVGNETLGTWPPTGGAVQIHDSYFELSDSTTFLKTLATSKKSYVDFSFTNNQVNCNAGTSYLLSITNTVEETYRNILISGNIFGGSGLSLYSTFSFVGDERYTHIDISDNVNPIFDPEIITNPWQNSGTYYQTVSFKGSAANPTASVSYRAVGGDFMVSSVGGTGVNITIYDKNNVAWVSGLASYNGLLPNGYRINFGAFSVAPSTKVYMMP